MGKAVHGKTSVKLVQKKISLQKFASNNYSTDHFAACCEMARVTHDTMERQHNVSNALFQG
jgi:hypothetical protein